MFAGEKIANGIIERGIRRLECKQISHAGGGRRSSSDADENRSALPDTPSSSQSIGWKWKNSNAFLLIGSALNKLISPQFSRMTAGRQI